MKNAVIYARFSCSNQTEQSIEGQLRVCRDYAARNNFVIINEYIDRAKTGTNDSRPGFKSMIKDSAKGKFDTVLVYKLDRFARNKYDSAIHKHTLRQNGVAVVSVTENIPVNSPEGIIFESVLEGFAEYYSAELSQKVKRGLKESYAKGNYTGGYVLYGFETRDRKVYIKENEAQIVREIFNRIANGETAVAIAESLKKRGIRNNYNKYFTNKSIFKMIYNIKYNGRVVHNDEEFSNIFPKIIDDDLFDKVQDCKYSI